MRVFITGIAGFIGYHVATSLKREGIEVCGIDNFNSYYDPLLKRERAKQLFELGVDVIEGDICDKKVLSESVDEFSPTHILHLAAQAGVRYSLVNPEAYVRSNLMGFTEVLELVRFRKGLKLVYASSSSVYGLNSKLPYSIKDPTDAQASFYGVTKKSNELMAASYRHLFGIKAIGLRFFTVYGPLGRPDMAYFSFTKAIREGKPIQLYNFGKMMRDFTYVDDIVRGVIAALKYEGEGTLFNLGNNKPESLIYFVETLEKLLNKEGKKELLPFQPGDVHSTFADIEESQKELNFYPRVRLEEGLKHFVNWYVDDYDRLNLNPAVQMTHLH